MSVYSFSQLQLFQQCPRKYQYKYVDQVKEKEFESSPDLILGQSVHKVLENLYNNVNVFKIPSLEDVMEDFHNTRNEEMEKATKEKPLQIKGQQTLEDYIRRGEHYVNAYYKKYSPFENVKVIATESMMHFQLDKDGQKKFRGVIDRIDKDGDTFIINDYKTNKNLPPEQKQEYIEQQTLYGLGIQQKYGKYLKNIKARLHYLHFDITDEREITDEVLAPIVEKYSSIIEGVEHKKFAYNMGNKRAFEPIQNEYCKYCEYMTICPLRAHMKYDDEVIGGELGEKTVKHLVDEYVQFSKQESESKAQKELLKDMLVEYLEKKGFLKLFGNTYKISASQGESISIKDKDLLLTKLQELGILNEALDIDRFKVQKLVKEGKLDTTKLDGSVEKKPSRTLRGSKL
ncbi:MAG: PD-(D/E)XK nuclease family protein [Candidatus Absconditabacteria bacterium]|nr:PD-(D/E)XK nuclease family protein [Candidatus Absconditabacteria bacterium]